ncbi:hypothetical protein HS7_21210 [Sulfolobales archaeon HS-7]|nr:hypothetical protein HS7_21210 [Sulfolobales archaeon HS-7]
MFILKFSNDQRYQQEIAELVLCIQREDRNCVKLKAERLLSIINDEIKELYSKL